VYHIQCRGCGTSAFADCACERLGHDPSVAGAHHPQCPMTDPDGLVACPPGSACCQDDHSGDPDRRGHALLACAVDHSAAACPEPAGCHLWASVKAHHASMAAHQAAPGAELRDAWPAEDLPDDCPGGHHGLGVEGCGVCRALVVTAVGAGATLRAVS
jgi:hypothetical protein